MGWRLPGAFVWASSSTSTSWGLRASTASRSISSSQVPLYSTRRRGMTSSPSRSAWVSVSPVRLDHADHDVDAVLPFGPGGFQHLVGLAHAGSGPEEDLEPARGRVPPGALPRAAPPARVVWPERLAAAAHRLTLSPSRAPCRSRARFSASTLTRGSPKNPSCRSSTCWVDELAHTHPPSRPRALATRGHLEQRGLGRDVRDRDRCPRWSRGRSERPRTDCLSSERPSRPGPARAGPCWSARDWSRRSSPRCRAPAPSSSASFGSAAVVADGRPWK